MNYKNIIYDLLKVINIHDYYSVKETAKEFLLIKDIKEIYEEINLKVGDITLIDYYNNSYYIIHTEGKIVYSYEIPELEFNINEYFIRFDRKKKIEKILNQL